jgi:hypothetical protein
MPAPRCRFCSSPAVARFRLSDGCAVYPDDRGQDLCEHHARKASPRGGLVLAEDYTAGAAFTKTYTGQG